MADVQDQIYRNGDDDSNMIGDRWVRSHWLEINMSRKKKNPLSVVCKRKFVRTTFDRDSRFKFDDAPAPSDRPSQATGPGYVTSPTVCLRWFSSLLASAKSVRGGPDPRVLAPQPLVRHLIPRDAGPANETMMEPIVSSLQSPTGSTQAGQAKCTERLQIQIITMTLHDGMIVCEYLI